MDERLRKWTRVRRRTYQSVLAFDVFLTQLQKTRPCFSTFFTNHVASTLHRFWAAHYPGDYQDFECGFDWVQTYRHEVRWVMDRADAMLGRLLSFTERNPDYEVWVTTSMGQEATEARRANSQVYLRELATFLGRLGVEEGTWDERPAMAPRAIFALEGGRDPELERKLGGIEISDRGALGWDHLGAGVYRIHPGVQKDVIDSTIFFEGSAHTFEEFGFANLLLEDQVGQTAYHVPEGLLLISNGAGVRRAERPRISTLEIAPMILQRFGVTAPDYMLTAPGRLQVTVAA